MISKMGGAKTFPATLTADKTSYGDTDKIMLTLAASSFTGLLLYATASDAPSTQTVGTFSIPSGFQNNAGVCKNSDFPDSSVTHTSGQSYASVTFTYTPNAAKWKGDLRFHVIVSQGTGRFTYFISDALLVKYAASQTSTNSSDIPPPQTATNTSIVSSAPSASSTVKSKGCHKRRRGGKNACEKLKESREEKEDD
jgi:hypothetical protein